MDLFKTIFIFPLFVDFSCCYLDDLKPILRDRLDELRLSTRKMYGGVTVRKPMKLWELDLEDRLAYPRGDKSKLVEIANQWLQYYECSVNSLHRVRATGAQPATSLVAYAGAVLRIPCGVCVAPPDKGGVNWLYAESLKNLTFLPMEEKPTAVIERDTLTIYHVKEQDAGVYKCRAGGSNGGPIILQVIDYEHNYTVVKPPSSHGPYTTPPVVDRDLVVFTSWSAWSSCSRCGRWGRRRRYGMCHVKTAESIKKKIDFDEELDKLCMEGRKFLEAFPQGVYCRSKYLPSCIKDRPAVRTRNNEIMLRLCKTPCKKDVIFYVVSSNGVVLERANNSGGIYSLAQPRPPQPPPPARDILYAVRGTSVILRCPGTCYRDMPVSWRAGNSRISELVLERNSDGTVRVNARDHLVFRAVCYSHAALYSCWQEDVLCGEVKLEVWSGGGPGTRRALLLSACVAALYTLRLLFRAHRARLRRMLM